MLAGFGRLGGQELSVKTRLGEEGFLCVWEWTGIEYWSPAEVRKYPYGPAPDVRGKCPHGPAAPGFRAMQDEAASTLFPEGIWEQ